ncbi:hypothetical protein ACFX2I_004812 [Malus domestica]
MSHGGGRQYLTPKVASSLSSSEVVAAVKETEPLVAPSPSESSEVTALMGTRFWNRKNARRGSRLASSDEILLLHFIQDEAAELVSSP